MFITKSVIAAGTGILMYAGAGCISPTIVEDNGDVVTLKYGPWETAHELLGRADALCDAHDKTARLARDASADLDPPFRYATFDCMPRQESS